MSLIEEAIAFEQEKTSFKTTSDRIKASRKAKALILGVNEIYKENQDPELMDLMKRLTVVKQKIEKRLKGRSLAA
jgi:UDP-N-acetyl-D-mannosaminuronate dehydrogenase